MMRLFAIVLGMAVVLALRPALAQMESREAIQLQNQMLELRREVQALREQVRSGSTGGSSLGLFRGSSSAPTGGGEMTTALLERVVSLEETVRRLHGKLDEVDNARRRQGEDLKKDIDDLGFKLATPGIGSPPSRPAVPPATVNPSVPPAVLPPSRVRRTPEVAMQEGNAALARRDYATAEAAAREVLNFPRSPRATDAQFLLAQALTGKRDHQNAAVAFDDAYNRAKTGARAPDALLGLANALVAINEKKAACATLDKLKAEFASPRADLRDPIAAARQRATCR